jgi:serine protease Do
MPEPEPQRGLGSGVVVADNVIVTNNHVVEGADELRITTADKREITAEVAGTDPRSDLAVLRIKGKIEGLKPIEFGDSQALRPGDVVLAVGNPFGVGQTVTMGIVSAKGRADLGIVDYEDFIQTDAAINPGNSGGALVNMEGKLVGVNTAILSRTGAFAGVGFAIPSEMVKPIMQSLLENGKVVRGWLGVTIQDVDAELARAMSLPSASGVLISDLAPGGPAARAGVQRGDVVVRIDGKPVESTGRLRNLIAAAGARGKVSLDLVRKGKPQTLSVELGEMPNDPSNNGSLGPATSSGMDGLTVAVGVAARLDHLLGRQALTPSEPKYVRAGRPPPGAGACAPPCRS